MAGRKDFVVVRLDAATKEAVERAAAAEDLPVSTWIRNQIVASLYLAGVREAPQVIYQGLRHALQAELDQIVWTRVAADALLGVLPEVLTALLPPSDPRRPAVVAEAIRDIIAERTRELFAESE